jgi:hypothetical protein
MSSSDVISTFDVIQLSITLGGLGFLYRELRSAQKESRAMTLAKHDESDKSLAALDLRRSSDREEFMAKLRLTDKDSDEIKKQLENLQIKVSHIEGYIKAKQEDEALDPKAN